MLSSLFSIAIPPPLDVMTALVLAFVFGIGMAMTGSETLKRTFAESRTIIELLIVKAIVPLLPLHIFGLFLNMAHSGAAVRIISDFGRVVGVIFALHLLLLLIQFTIAGLVARRNPLRMLQTMLPAYMTALGTASSAATIPVTLTSAKKLGIHGEVADFCIPLCATIHLSGSMLKITATALAICLMDGLPHNPALFAGFIMLLAVMMVAAPGVPGGAIMAATGVLQSSLGFGEP
jgi:Na+/H+-dicarboxylate symporter